MKDLSIDCRGRGKINICEFLIVLFFVLGLFVGSDLAKIVRYILSLFIQIFLLVIAKRHNKKIFTQYCFVILCVCLTVVNFLLNSIEMSLIINRALPLLSMFGVILIGENTRRISIKKVLQLFCKTYVLLMVAVIADYVFYLIIGRAIFWDPYIYLGARATGPLGDPNFLGLFSVATLIILCNMDFKKRYKYFATFVLGVVILLSMSISTWLIFLVSLVAYKVLPKNNRNKMVIIFTLDLLFLLVYSAFREQIFDLGVKAMTAFYNGDVEAGSIKFGSAMIRFDTQALGVEKFLENWIGQGPHQMVSQLGHDTHNSYISFLFEGGVPELLIIFVTLRGRCRNRFNNLLATFLMLFALLLNVHDTAIYSLFLLSQYYDDSQDEHNLRKNTKKYGEGMVTPKKEVISVR